MIDKKAAGGKGVIVLGIICVILAVCLVVAIADYTSIIRDKDTTIATKDSVIATKDLQISNLNNQLSDLNSTVNDLNSTANDLSRVVKLEKTQYWAGGEPRYYNASSYDGWSSNAGYAGYLEVDVQSNATSTYVRVTYYSLGVNYDNQVVVGAGSTRTYFPILPTLEVTTRVGNTNLSDGALIAVTIIYHY